jgi:ELWxxDGT repeat protein
MWFSSFWGSRRSASPRIHTNRRPPARLHVEALEDRCLLASDLSAVLVADIEPGADSSHPHDIIDADGTLYFYAADPRFPSKQALWNSDGTAAGTVLVKDQITTMESELSNLASIGGTVFFNAPYQGFTYLWKTDGTAAGTIPLEELGAEHLTAVNDKVFFTAWTDTGNELWVSDGTENGTKLVKDIHHGTHKECHGAGGPRHNGRGNLCYNVPNDSDPQWLTDVSGTLFFTAYDGTGRYLWKSDGTRGGTTVVKTIGAAHLTNVNGTLFFSGPAGGTGWELWKSDGSSEGTVLVHDSAPGIASGNPENLTDVDGTLLFTTDDGIHGRELWKSDGTAVGTLLVKDIVPGSDGAVFRSFANLDGSLAFTVDDGIHGAELWKSDGSAGGTVLVRDIRPGAGSATPAQLTNVNGLLYFTANDGTHGRELWQSDGSEAGTLMQDIYPGSTGSNPASLVAANNKLYFAATDPEHGRELWDPPPVEPDGEYLLVTDYDNDSVLRYDGTTGEFVDTFVPRGSGGLNQPWFLRFGPHDGNLYVGSGHFRGPGQEKAVLRYDGTTGMFIDTFVDSGPPSENVAPDANDVTERHGLLTSVHGISFGPDGNGDGLQDLYVADWTGPEGPDEYGLGRILRFDGITGEFLDVFVPANPDLGHPWTLVFAPDGPGNSLDLYVGSLATSAILRYDGETGAFLGEFVPSGSGGLSGPLAMTFGPDGNLYVGDTFGGNILRYQGPSGSSPGAFIDVFVPPGSGGLLEPSAGLLFGPDGNSDGHQDLYVANSDFTGIGNDQGRYGNVKRYDGLTGEFIDTFVAIGSGGLNNIGGMTFTQTDPMTLAYTGPRRPGALLTESVASSVVAGSITLAQLDSILTEALVRWEAAGADLSRLGPVQVAVTDLPGATLGLASGATIWLDVNAAGWGWFVDATPWADSEFSTPGDQGEQERMDLLTVLMHEFGHVLGYEHGAEALMQETLSPGTRLGWGEHPDVDYWRDR